MNGTRVKCNWRKKRKSKNIFESANFIIFFKRSYCGEKSILSQLRNRMIRPSYTHFYIYRIAYIITISTLAAYDTYINYRHNYCVANSNFFIYKNFCSWSLLTLCLFPRLSAAVMAHNTKMPEIWIEKLLNRFRYS